MKKILLFIVLALTGCSTTKTYLLPEPINLVNRPAAFSGYVVTPGDCLWNISKKVYNDPFMWWTIYKENLGLISNPDIIEPGYNLKIKTNMVEFENRVNRRRAYIYKE